VGDEHEYGHRQCSHAHPMRGSVDLDYSNVGLSRRAADQPKQWDRDGVDAVPTVRHRPLAWSHAWSFCCASKGHRRTISNGRIILQTVGRMPTARAVAGSLFSGQAIADPARVKLECLAGYRAAVITAFRCDRRRGSLAGQVTFPATTHRSAAETVSQDNQAQEAIDGPATDAVSDAAAARALSFVSAVHIELSCPATARFDCPRVDKFTASPTLIGSGDLGLAQATASPVTEAAASKRGR